MGPKGQSPEDQATSQQSTAEPSTSRQDADLLRPFLVTGRGVYMGPMGPQGKGRVPRSSSTGSPVFTLEDSSLSRPSATTSSAEQMVRHTQIVEVRPRREPPIEVYLHDKEESLLPRPFWMTSKEGERPASIDPQGIGKGAPQPSSTGAPISPMEKDNAQRPSLMVSNIQCPTTVWSSVVKDGPSPQIRAAARIFLLKEGSVGRGASSITTSSSMVMSLKSDIPQSHAVVLEVAKSKLVREMKPLRTTLPDKKGCVATSLQRGSPNPGVLSSKVDPPFDGPAIGLQSARAKSALDQGQLRKVVSTMSRVHRTSRALSAEGQVWGKLAADRYSTAKETQPHKGKVYTSITKVAVPFDVSPKIVEVKKTRRFDLSPPKAAALCVARVKSSAEDTNLCQAMSSTRIVNPPASPSKVLCQHTGLVGARGHSSHPVHLHGPPVVTNIAGDTTNPLGAQGPVTRVLAASGSLMTKGVNPFVDVSTRKIMFARGNRDAFVLAANTPPFHPPREEPQVLPKLARSEGDRPSPHPGSVPVVSSRMAQVRPGELSASEDMRRGHPRRHPPPLHVSRQSKFSSVPGKFPKLGRRHQRR